MEREADVFSAYGPEREKEGRSNKSRRGPTSWNSRSMVVPGINDKDERLLIVCRGEYVIGNTYFRRRKFTYSIYVG